MQASAIAEKEILMMLDHPCIVVLYNTSLLLDLLRSTG